MLDDADIEGWRDEEAALRSVRKGLPRQPTQEHHFAALPYADVPALVTRLKKPPDNAGRDALLFTILNAVRSGETRLASWSENDLKGAVWTIPATRMTMKRSEERRVGKECVIRVDTGGRRNIKTKNKTNR